MNTKLTDVSVSVNGRTFQTSLKLEPYVIQLRSAFGTAHSSTTSRTNVLLTFTLTLSPDKVIIGTFLVAFFRYSWNPFLLLR